MTELKPLEDCPFCLGEAISVDGYTARCSKGEKEMADKSCAGALVRFPIKLWNARSPQSLTEKVKLEPLDIQEVQRCIVEDKEAIKWTNIENGNYWPLANAICQRFGQREIKYPTKDMGCMHTYKDEPSCYECSPRNEVIDEFKKLNPDTKEN